MYSRGLTRRLAIKPREGGRTWRRDIPAAAERLVDRDQRESAFAVGGNQVALSGERGAFGVEPCKRVSAAGLILLVGQSARALGRAPARGKRFGASLRGRVPGERILGLLERLQDRALVVRQRTVRPRPRGAKLRVQAAVVEKPPADSRCDAPASRSGISQVVAGEPDEAKESLNADFGKQSSGADTDLRGREGERAFRTLDVRTPPQQLGGRTDANWLHLGAHARGGSKRQLTGSDADEHREPMPVSMRCAVQIRQDGFRLMQQRFGARCIERRAATRVEAALRDAVAIAQGGKLARDERDRLFGVAQREVVRGDFGKERNLGVAQRCAGDAEFGVGRFDAPS